MRKSVPLYTTFALSSTLLGVARNIATTLCTSPHRRCQCLSRAWPNFLATVTFAFDDIVLYRELHQY